MTPAINLLKKLRINFDVLQFQHDTSAESYGLEAVNKLGLQAHCVFKTLVVKTDKNSLVTAIIPVENKLNLKLLAKHLGYKKIEMADASRVENTTGYLLGGVSPIAQKRRLTTILDHSAKNLDTIYVSAGRRGLEIAISPSDLLKLTNGEFADITQ